jgi:hypothetical protein
MYSPAIHSVLVNSRIDELNRDAQPVVRPRIAGAVKHQLHGCASALATYFRPAMAGVLVEKYA